MKEEKVILTNTAYQILGKILTSSLGFVMTFLLTRYLGVTGFGQYSFVLAFVGIAFWFADFGLEPVVIRHEAAGTMTQGHFSSYITLRGLLVLATFLVLTVLSYVLPYSSFIRYGIMIAALGQGIFTFTSVILSVLKGRLHYSIVVLTGIAITVVHFVMVVIGVYYQLDPLFFFVSFTLGYGVGLAISTKISPYAVVLNFDTKALVKALREALPFAMAIVVSIASVRIDTLMLGYFFNPEVYPDVGYYALGLRIFDVIIVFGGFYAQTLYPYFSQHTYIPSRLFMRLLGNTSLLAIGAMIAMFALAQPIVDILGGGDFAASAGVIRVLTSGAGIVIILGFFNSYLISIGKESMWLAISVVALVLNVVLNVLFIPEFSYIGASITTVLTQGLSLILTSAFVLHYRHTHAKA